LERSTSLVLLQVGGLRCSWQQHALKPSCLECSTAVEQAETQLRVVVPIEEEEFMQHNGVSKIKINHRLLIGEEIF
jgi:hypothetical protein